MASEAAPRAHTETKALASHGEGSSQFALLRERRFAPFFWTQFLGAFNDNLFKFAFTVLVTFHASANSGFDPALVVNLIAGLTSCLSCSSPRHLDSSRTSTTSGRSPSS